MAIRFGVHSLMDNFFVERLNVETLIAVAKRYGADFIEFMAHPSAFKVPAQDLKKMMRDANLWTTLCNVILAGDGDPLSPDEASRVVAEDHVKRTIELAHFLHAPIVGGPLLWVLGRNYELNFRLYERAIYFLQKMAHEAQKAGVKLCIEWLNPDEGNVLTSTADAVVLLKKVGDSNVAMLLDTFHAALMGEKIVDSLVLAKRHLAAFHASGGERQAAGNDTGRTGAVDWDAFVEGIVKIHSEQPSQDIWLGTETFGPACQKYLAAAAKKYPPAGTTEEIVSKAIPFLRKLVEKRVARLCAPR